MSKRVKNLDAEALPLGNARYQELLKSNEPPLEIERPLIESVVSRLRDRLSSHDEKISRSGLRTRLKRRTEERESLATDLARNAVILSPLRRLPPEILFEIFSFTLPFDWEVKARGSSLDVKESPWLLTRICSRWRTVALASSSFWTFIVIDDDAWSGRSTSLVSLLQLQLDRTRTSPLRVHFETSNSHSRRHAPLFDLLAERSRQWVKAHLVLTPELFPTLATIRNRIPLLRTLWFQSSDNPDLSQTLVGDHIDCFLAAPALQAACIILEESLPSVLLPAHQLTHYQLAAAWQMHVDILKIATNLLEARIYITEDSLHAVPPQIIELLNLRLLAVTHVGILDFLTVPALRQLDLVSASELDINWSNEFDAAHYIDSMVSRSSCVIEKLVAYGDGPIVDLVVAVLSRNQSIVEFMATFTAESTEEANTLISSLARQDTEGVFNLAPQLEAVSFGVTDDGTVDYDLFHDMLASRWAVPRCGLRSGGLLISVDAAGTPGAQAIRHRMDDLRKTGLDVLFVAGSEADHILCQWLLGISA
ncbi:hypothetical protein B0H16DRAFT_650874 [Mycena metata]|uniref:F-box domain-containing protein n=1 Tax=Mycena metata TaxID=1033252 RepID=A0AAD7J8H1_9AGAR|nr:hypothetical protein B0H16DRAFT_650874 [Mycena metata]